MSISSIQDRILGASPPLEAETPEDLLRQMRRQLLEAYGKDCLRTSQQVIFQWVKLEPDPHGVKRKAGEYAIIGGEKDFRRDPACARIVRDDGAFLHFTLTVRWDGNKQLSLLAYDFELVFPETCCPPFVRLDLNPEGHRNEEREMRCHVHPGNDDLQLPAPLMTPKEILHLLVHGLRPRDADKPRA